MRILPGGRSWLMENIGVPRAGPSMHRSRMRFCGRHWMGSTMTTLRRQSSGYFNDLLHAKAQVIATDYKGKGGISIELVFPSYQDQKDLRLDFVCAHLDSEMNEKRHFGVAELLSEACGKKGDLRQPCALFDRELPSCNVTEGSHLPPPPDAVFLFGDLNYRLKKTGLEDMSQDRARKADRWGDGVMDRTILPTEACVC
eukprot:g7881.t1